MPRFSIVIPVYNAEKRVKKSLESLIVQTHSDFEVIVVDDGSTDSSAKIVTTYSRQDSRIKLYQQKNRGVSSARNHGLSKANGDYITFVDSDDEVTPNYLATLNKQIINTRADIIFFGYTSLDESNLSSEIHVARAGYLEKLTTKFEKVEYLNDNNLYGYTWCKCIKKECVGATRFRDDLCLLEDEIFIGEILCKTNQIVILPEALYRYYTCNSNSLSGRTYQNYCKICDEAFKIWVKIFPIEHKAIRKKASSLFTQCIFYAFERDVDFKDFIQSLKSTAYIRHVNGKTASPWIEMVRLGQLHKLHFHKCIYTIKNYLSLKINSIFKHV